MRTHLQHARPGPAWKTARMHCALLLAAACAAGCDRPAEATPDEIFAASKPFQVAAGDGAELIGAAAALAPDPRRDLAQMGFQDAIEAFGYPRLREWAEALDPNAALFVAIAHIRGASGALRNDAQASQWLLRAANLGAVEAQDAIGLWAYREALRLQSARNMPKATRMTVRAHAWFNLAQAHGHPAAARHLQELIATLQPNDAATRHAQSLAATWRRCESRSCWDLHPDGERAAF